MKKTPVKITLLLIGIGAAVAGVLIFVSTMISPPRAAEKSDVVSASIDQAAATFDNGNYKDTDNDFDIYYDYILRLDAEEMIDDDTRDKRLAQAIVKYGPRFCTGANNYFSRSVWEAKDIEQIANRGNFIASTIKDFDDKATESLMSQLEDVNSGINEINKVIAEYREAIKLGNNSGFGNIGSVRERLQRARALRRHPQIGHVTYVVDRLKSLPERIEASHFAYLENKVRQVREKSYGSATQYEFENAKEDAYRKISEYSSNAGSLYGDFARSTSDISQRLAGINYTGN